MVLGAAPPTAVPEAVAPPPGNPRYPLYDSLRALAALSIVGVHVALFSDVFNKASYGGVVAHLDIGVTVFFAISGFLLYRPMLASRILGAPRTPIGVYARRRFLRIAPAYWLALTVLAIFPGVYGVFTGNWWVYYGLLQNYPIYTRTGNCVTGLYASFNCGISPAWSLGIEVFFYATLPLFALGMARVTRRLTGARWLWAELAVLALIAVFSVWVQEFRIQGDLETVLFYSPLGRGWWFAVGMGLAAVSVRVQQLDRPPGAVQWVSDHPWVPWVAAVALYLGPALLIFKPIPSISGPVVPLREYVGAYLLFGVISALVLVPATFGDPRRSAARRILGHPVVAWLGLISYGIFLWHFPIVYALRAGGVDRWWPGHAYPVLLATTLAITIACAALSYYLVERPLMRWKRSSRRQSARARAAGAAPRATAS